VVRGEPGAWERDGAAAAQELLDICRGAGTRLIGPASFGVLDNRPGRVLDLTAGAERPPHGSVGIVAQGAGAAGALLEGAVRRGLGVSTFVDLGARADLTANDLLEYWEKDPATTVALLQVESFSDPRRFARVARRVGARMPIIVIAERAAAAPPGRGLFDQVGAIRVDGVHEALDLALELAGPPNVEAWRDLPAAPTPTAVPRSDEAAALIAAVLRKDGGDTELDAGPCARFLDCYGIEVDAGAAETDGAGGASAGATALRIAVAPDPLFGPVLRCGLADAPAEEVPARLCPLAEGDATDLLDRLELGEAASPVGIASLERALDGAATAAAAHAEIAALELDQLLVTEGRAVATAARIKVRRPPERHPWPRTWE
jgi:hypothetical protein